nr:efflux RND transporter periplasmic adaptor subunit [Dyella sedimenti]
MKELRIEKHQREDHGQGPGRWPWIAAVVLAVLVVAGLGAWWLAGSGPVEVRMALAQPAASAASAGAVLQATGYVTARRQATVSAQITGTLTQVLIEEGDRVKQGQIVARLDDAQYRAALEAARTQAAAAHALVSQYQAQLAQNQRDAVRAETLAAKGLIARQDAEQARTLVDSTRAQLLSQQRVAASADAQVVEAQVNFDYCVIHAPFDGVITTKDAQVGEIVSPFSAGGGFTRTGIGTVVDMDSLEVDVDVNEAYIGRVKPDMPAEAVLDAYPDWRIPAHVIAIVPAADRGKATVKVRVALEQKDARIVPDMGVRVSFLEQKATATQAAAAPKGVLVPAAAIVQRDGRSVVFVMEGNRVRQRVVTPSAAIQGELRLLPSGVEPGEGVVASPPASLKDGMRVAKPKE